MNRLHSLDEMVQLGYEQAQRTLIGTKEQIAPSWLLQSETGERILIMTPWGNSFEKELIQAQMRKAMKEHLTLSYSIVLEAWASYLAPGEVQKVRPSKDPNRYELVMVVATDGSAIRIRQFRIIRDPITGKCRELEEVPVEHDEKYSSPFLELLRYTHD